MPLKNLNLIELKFVNMYHLEGLTPSIKIQSIARNLFNGARYVMIEPRIMDFNAIKLK